MISVLREILSLVVLLVAAGFSLRGFKETQTKVCGYQEFFKKIQTIKSAATNIISSGST